jgi:hypothetical protein
VFTDGDPSLPDIDIRACHTQTVACQESEGSLRCGKRALIAGDWETALRAFSRTALPGSAEFGEAIYGRYLARLFRLYANWNNMFCNGLIHNGFNKKALTRDLNNLEFPWGRIYQQQYTCLVNQVYFWSSTWELISNCAGSHILLVADIVSNNDGFQLTNAHSIVPNRDQGRVPPFERLEPLAMRLGL